MLSLLNHFKKTMKDQRGFLSIFSRKKKQNWTPDIPMPTQEQLFHTNQLRDFATDRISGKTAGFGDEFVDRASNPVIQSREARFRDVEMPQLSSQLSSRGLARSAGPNLATDVLTRAGQTKERDVNEILAQFYTLNEAQKKRDITEGVGVGERMNAQQNEMKQNQALASERLANRTGEAQLARQASKSADLDRLGAALTSVIGTPGLFGGGGASPQILGTVPGIGRVSTYGADNIPQGFSSYKMPSVGSNILGSVNQGSLSQLLQNWDILG